MKEVLSHGHQDLIYESHQKKLNIIQNYLKSKEEDRGWQSKIFEGRKVVRKADQTNNS